MVSFVIITITTQESCDGDELGRELYVTLIRSHSLPVFGYDFRTSSLAFFLSINKTWSYDD